MPQTKPWSQPISNVFIDNPSKVILDISRQFNEERDVPKLLELILTKARNITQADAGSIYTRRGDYLDFRYTQNDSLTQHLQTFTLPVSNASVVGHAVITKKSINIEDLYDLKTKEHKDFFGIKHDNLWDNLTGYESHSMLTIPMMDISQKVIGVIQLINCKSDPTALLQKPQDFVQYVKKFDPLAEEYGLILAHQAGIALENANLQTEIEELFHSFVNASVSAIEIRDPTTSGHSHRVASLTLGLAKAVNDIEVGAFQHVYFDAKEQREIEYASLLHDFGKLGVKESVLVKAKKLYPMELEVLRERFRSVYLSIEVEYFKKILDGKIPKHELDQWKQNKILMVDEYMDFIIKANEPSILEDGDFRFLEEIANDFFFDHKGQRISFLRPEEIKALSVRKGSLTGDEFSEIQSHVSLTYEFLKKIPWGLKLANVPEIASKHHEKLDRSGYPLGLSAKDIPLQSRMMTIADIFDALTANDRPYKKAVSVERALDILHMDVSAGKLDRDLFDVFVTKKVYHFSF